MKRFLTTLTFVMLLFTLVGCKKGESQLEIKGVEDVEITLGEEFNPLEGIEAFDKKDGDLTKDIKVEGEVDVNEPGKYELKYEVENSQGKKAEAKRVVTVLSLANLKNGDFSDGLNGWTTWYADAAYDVNYGVEDGVAVIDINVEDLGNTEWWGVQLAYKNLNLEKYTSYKLVFTVKADADRYMNYQVQGGGIDKAFGEHNLILITEEEQTIEKEFSVKNDTEGTELQFSFGNFDEGVYGQEIKEEYAKVSTKVYISNVKLVYGPELENQAPTLEVEDVLLEVGETDFMIMQGVKVEDDRDNLTIKDVKYEDVSEGEKFELPAKKGIYKIKYTVEDSEGLTAEVIRTITVADTFDIPSFNNVGENGLPIGWEAWGEDTRGGISVNTKDGVAEIDITNVGSEEEAGNIWENQFKTLNLVARKGSYTLKFKAKADISRVMIVAMEGGGIENVQVDIVIKEEWTEHTIELEIREDVTGRNLQFWFGDLSNFKEYTKEDNILTKVYLKEVEIVENK